MTALASFSGRLVGLCVMVWLFTVMWNGLEVFAMPKITFWDALTIHALVYNVVCATRWVCGCGRLHKV